MRHAFGRHCNGSAPSSGIQPVRFFRGARGAWWAGRVSSGPCVFASDRCAIEYRLTVHREMLNHPSGGVWELQILLEVLFPHALLP